MMTQQLSAPSTRICPSCDLKQNIPALQHGERAYCPRCRELLHEHSGHGLRHVLVWHSTTLLLLFVTLTHPFLGLRAGSIENNASLPDGFMILWEQGFPLVALLVLLTGLLLPLLYTISVLYLSTPLFFTYRPPFALHVCHLIHQLRSWSMIEVLALGVLVALIKLFSVADVIFGPAFMALIAVTYTFTLSVRSLDMELLWDTLGKPDAA